MQGRTQTIFEIAEAELRNIADRASRLPTSVPELAFIKKLAGGIPIALDTGVHDSQRPRDSNQFYFDSLRNTFHLSMDFIASWERLRSDRQLSRDQIGRALRAFFLHEYFHIAQQLTSPRHSDARSAQTCTSTIDYYADACAALALYYMTDQDDQRWQDRFAAAIEGTYWAMVVFENPVTTLRSMRLKRHFRLHYQYHRCKHFRGEDLTRIQLLFMPSVDFSGMTGGTEYSREAVANLHATTAGPISWMVAPDENSMPRFIRLRPPPDRMASLVDGIYSADIQRSYPFFEHLFDENRFLVGGLAGDQPAQPITRHFGR